MDRRQKKTREAIFAAFTDLLAGKRYEAVTVSDIIERADVGRATFYAHFATKDHLLKELCHELFCHIFDATKAGETAHRHIFSCNAPQPAALHLLRHFKNNDNRILTLLASDSNEVFLRYFKESLRTLIEEHPLLLGGKMPPHLPAGYWSSHVAAAFVETVRWWAAGGMKESPETISSCFLAVI